MKNDNHVLLVPVLLKADQGPKAMQTVLVHAQNMDDTRGQYDVRRVRNVVVCEGKMYSASASKAGMKALVSVEVEPNAGQTRLSLEAPNLWYQRLDWTDDPRTGQRLMNLHSKLSYQAAKIVHMLGFTSVREYRAAVKYMDNHKLAAVHRESQARLESEVLETMTGEHALTPNQVRAIVRSFEKQTHR